MKRGRGERGTPTMHNVHCTGGTIILIDPSMGLERYNYCIGKSDPAMCVWIKGTKMKWLKVRIIFSILMSINNYYFLVHISIN